MELWFPRSSCCKAWRHAGPRHRAFGFEPVGVDGNVHAQRMHTLATKDAT